MFKGKIKEHSKSQKNTSFLPHFIKPDKPPQAPKKARTRYGFILCHILTITQEKSFTNFHSSPKSPTSQEPCCIQS